MAYDNIDTELINAMLGNGRASLRTLAEELDVSVTTVSNHLKDLEEEGVVTGYTPIIDYDRLGYDVTAVLQLNVEGSAIPDVTAHLTEIKELTSVYEVTGEFDIIAIGKFRDTDEMNARIKEILSDGDITGSSTSVVLNAAAENEQFDLDVE